MKFFHRSVLVVLSLSFVLLAHTTSWAKDEWIQIKSKNFLLMGNASEKEIKKVGTRLEQFRETFRQLFGKTNLTSPIPTNVIVFKSASSYKNFKPKRSDGKIDTGVAGYFQSGEDVNYITLSTEGEDADTFGTIFHEYVHFIVNTNFGRSDVPAWFNEGLAEYYQTFQIVDDQIVKVGIFQDGHLELLRQNKLIPLDQLFNVSNRQLTESGGHSRHIFYAQSWALMHYLLQTGKGDRLGNFLGSVSKGVDPRKAFGDAFLSDYGQMETELRKYVGQSKYQYNKITFKNKLTFDGDMIAEPMSEAVSNAYLGDLLYHTNRADDAEQFLQNALTLDPSSSMAQTTLGMVKLRQRKYDEAKSLLEKAIAGDRKNHMAFFRYAYLLSREGRDEFGMVRSFDEGTVAKMRDALKKAIAINPAFTESYELLAFINLVNGDALDESLDLMRSALKYQPGNQRYAMRIAEILIRQGKYADAGAIAEKIARTADDGEVRGRSQRLLSEIAQRKEYDERRAAAGNRISTGQTPLSRRKPMTEAELAKRQQLATLRSINESLRKPGDGEIRVIGSVQKIDCGPRPLLFTIKTPAETFIVTSQDFQGLTFNTFAEGTSNASLGCDEDLSAQNAIITYRTQLSANGKTRGEIKGVELVPADFRLMTEEEMAMSLGESYEQIERGPDSGDQPPRLARRTPGGEDPEQRAAMSEAIRNSLKKPAAGEKRDIGYLDKIECTNKGIYFHLRTAAQTLRLVNTSPQSLSITVFTPDLDGVQFGCGIKPVEVPAVFIYQDKPDAKAKTAGEIVSLAFVPKAFTLE